MIRLGLIGAQFIGNLYVYSLRQVSGATITAVASPNTAATFAARHSIPAYFTDYHELIRSAEIDAVAIAAPNDLHFDACLAAAEAGKHVLCEKPLAMSLAQSDRMVEACRQAGVVLFYAENLLFAPMYNKVRDLAKKGAVGVPFLVKQSQSHGGPYSPWFWDVDRSGGGVLLDMGCHSIHSICYTMGEWPEAVTATARQYKHADKGRGEDHTTVLLHFPGNRLGIAENSWAMPGGTDYLEVYGPEGRLTANLERGAALTMYRAPAEESAAETSASRSGWQFPMYEEAWQFGFPQELQHFVDIIEGRAESRSTGDDGRRVLEIICAAYESARTHQRVALPFPSTALKPIDHWLGA